MILKLLGRFTPKVSFYEERDRIAQRDDVKVEEASAGLPNGLNVKMQ